MTTRVKMKLRVSIGLCILFSLHCIGADRISSATIDGEAIKEISRVSLRPDGRILIIHDGTSGGLYPAEKFSKEFLSSWGITLDKVSAAKQEDFEAAVRLGRFRVVDGVVYDLRQKQPSWSYFQEVKLVQRLLSGAALVDPNPDQLSIAVIHVLNLPDTISDTDRFSLAAKQVGTFEYENKKGDTRVVRSYDAGRPCGRNEIPDEILKGGKPSAELPSVAGIQRNVLASLPDKDDLLCNGTGFFITDDGYLITNDHVVRGVHRVKVRLRSDIYDANVVKTDQDTDLALLKVQGGSFPALMVEMHKEASLGDGVFTIGFPNVDMQGIEPKYTDGRISSLAGLHDDPSQYQISVPVQPGNSGGPLLGASGQVVGVIVARISDLAVLRRSGSIPQNVNYAIKASTLREFLKSVRDLSGKMQAVGTDLQKETAIKKGQAGTVMVLGYR